MKKNRSIVFILMLLFVEMLQAQLHFNKQWDKTYGGTDGESFHSLFQTMDSGYMLGGSSSSGISGDKTEAGRGSSDIWLVKTDAIGNKEWDMRFGGIGLDAGMVTIQATDSGYLVGGYSTSGIGGDKTEAGRGGDDYWIVKIDALGNKQWDKRFGGSHDDFLWCTANTKDGGFILGGRSNSGLNADKTEDNRDPTNFYSDYWVVKIDSNGLKQWDKRFGGTDDDDLRSVQQTTDGGYILGGFSYSRTSGDKTEDNWDTVAPRTADYWVVKIDSVGHKEWDKRYGGKSQDELYTVLLGKDSGYILFGGGGEE